MVIYRQYELRKVLYVYMFCYGKREVNYFKIFYISSVEDRE